MLRELPRRSGWSLAPAMAGDKDSSQPRPNGRADPHASDAPALPPEVDSEPARKALRSYIDAIIKFGGDEARKVLGDELANAFPDLGREELGKLQFDIFFHVDRHFSHTLNRGRRSYLGEQPQPPMRVQLREAHDRRMAEITAKLAIDGTADAVAKAWLRARQEQSNPEQAAVNAIRDRHPELTLDEPYQVMVRLVDWLQSNYPDWWRAALRRRPAPKIVDSKSLPIGVVCSFCNRRVVIEPDGKPIDANQLRCTRCKRKRAEVRVLHSQADMKRFFAEGRN